MSSKAVDLAVRMTGDVSDVEQAFDDVGAAAMDMAQDVDRAIDMAESSASGLDTIGSAAETMGSKAGEAAGALGALSAGFDVVGLGAYSDGLQTASQAVQGLQGAGQTLKLVLDAAKASTIAQAVATKVVAGATKAYSIAQGILNAVLSANPIAIVVIAVAALVAGFVLAYKKSETFRTIVQGVMTAVEAYVKIPLTIIKTLANFVGDNAPKAFDKLQAAAKVVGDFFTSTIKPAFEAIMGPIDKIIAGIQKFIDLAGKVKLPKLPDLNPFGETATTTTLASPTFIGGPGGGGITFQLPAGPYTPESYATTVEDVLARRAVRFGPRVVNLV